MYAWQMKLKKIGSWEIPSLVYMIGEQLRASQVKVLLDEMINVEHPLLYREAIPKNHLPHSF